MKTLLLITSSVFIVLSAQASDQGYYDQHQNGMDCHELVEMGTYLCFGEKSKAHKAKCKTVKIKRDPGIYGDGLPGQDCIEMADGQFACFNSVTTFVTYCPESRINVPKSSQKCVEQIDAEPICFK